MAQNERWVTSAGVGRVLLVRLWMLESPQSNRQVAPPLIVVCKIAFALEQPTRL